MWRNHLTGIIGLRWVLGRHEGLVELTIVKRFITIRVFFRLFITSLTLIFGIFSSMRRTSMTCNAYKVHIVILLGWLIKAAHMTFRIMTTQIIKVRFFLSIFLLYRRINFFLILNFWIHFLPLRQNLASLQTIFVWFPILIVRWLRILLLLFRSTH